MQVMVVSRSAEARWDVATRLGLLPEAALAGDAAASRLAHPAVEPPDVVVLVVADDRDVAWLRAHTGRARGSRVPVVAVGGGPDRARALRRVGAAAILPEGADAAALRAAIDDVTGPAVVRRLPGSRSA